VFGFSVWIRRRVTIGRAGCEMTESVGGWAKMDCTTSDSAGRRGRIPECGVPEVSEEMEEGGVRAEAG
jgi:hypothetical protein